MSIMEGALRALTVAAVRLRRRACPDTHVDSGWDEGTVMPSAAGKHSPGGCVVTGTNGAGGEEDAG
jgi:hypothetical protein